MVPASTERLVHIAAEGATLEGALTVPAHAQGIVLFAHGSGSSRMSPRNNFVAADLRIAGFGTLLMDLLTREEDRDHERRFDIPLLTQRLEAVARWLATQKDTAALALGLFGASTGAAAALQAAATLGPMVRAVVSRGGRPDLAGTNMLQRVRSPTLLLVGGYDDAVIELNRKAYAVLTCPKEIIVIPGATHLFEEAGTLEQVVREARRWFQRFLSPAEATTPSSQ